jgi:ATP citrate (pro-S)-lyase
MSWLISSPAFTPYTLTANSRTSLLLSRCTQSLTFALRYLEINPLVVIPNKDATSAEVHFLDLAAKIDQTAEFECGVKWAIARSATALGIPNVGSKDSKVNIDAGPPLDFPAPFGRELSKEEAYIADLDAKTGASLKLTILNPNGRVWTLVAGGGASVVYADAIASAGYASELANYGEYSGAPTETQTFHYAKTVLDLMLRAPMHPDGKVLFIGGGIANFTNVSSHLPPTRHPSVWR